MIQGFFTAHHCVLSAQRGRHSGLLLDDSGYAQSSYLFTPWPHPTTTEQQGYNRANICIRGVVEHMFGVWKNRFQCLWKSMEDQNDPVVPVPVAENNQRGLALRAAFTLQHFH